MRHILFRNLSRKDAISIPPNNFPRRLQQGRSRPEGLGTNNPQRQTQRQQPFHLTSKPRLPTFPKIAPVFRSNLAAKRNSTTFLVNMPKRKSTHAESEPEQVTRRRSSRLSKGVESTEEVMAPVKEEKPQALSTKKKGGRKPAAVKEEEEKVEEKVEVSTRKLMSLVRHFTWTESSSHV